MQFKTIREPSLPAGFSMRRVTRLLVPEQQELRALVGTRFHEDSVDRVANGAVNAAHNPLGILLTVHAPDHKIVGFGVAIIKQNHDESNWVVKSGLTLVHPSPGLSRNGIGKALFSRKITEAVRLSKKLGIAVRKIEISAESEAGDKLVQKMLPNATALPVPFDETHPYEAKTHDAVRALRQKRKINHK